jgi:hypothetical protein
MDSTLKETEFVTPKNKYIIFYYKIPVSFGSPYVYTILIKPVVKYGTNTSVYNNITTVQRIRSQRDLGHYILKYIQAERYEIQYVEKKAKLSSVIPSASIPRR